DICARPRKRCSNETAHTTGAEHRYTGQLGPRFPAGQRSGLLLGLPLCATSLVASGAGVSSCVAGLAGAGPAALPGLVERRAGLPERLDHLRPSLFGGLGGFERLALGPGSAGEQIERPQPSLQYPRTAIEIGDHSLT